MRNLCKILILGKLQRIFRMHGLGNDGQDNISSSPRMSVSPSSTASDHRSPPKDAHDRHPCIKTRQQIFLNPASISCEAGGPPIKRIVTAWPPIA